MVAGSSHNDPVVKRINGCRVAKSSHDDPATIKTFYNWANPLEAGQRTRSIYRYTVVHYYILEYMHIYVYTHRLTW